MREDGDKRSWTRRMFGALLGLAVLALTVLMLSQWRPPSPEVSTTRTATPPPADTPLPREDPAPASPPYTGEDGVLVRGVVLDRETGAPVPGARVRLETAAGSWEVLTAADGTWSMTSPPQPVDRLIVRAEGYLPHRSRVEVPSQRSSTVARAIHLVRIVSGVRGRVVDPAGAPIPGARVEVDEWRHAGWFSDITSTDADGRFGPVTVAAGRARVHVEAPVRRIVDVPLTIVEGDPPAALEIVLHPARIGRGRVIDDAGRPIEGAIIDTVFETDPSVRTGADGRFVWPIRRFGTAYVRARKGGHCCTEEEHDIDGYREALIVLPRGRFVEGTVQRADGAPAAGVTLIGLVDSPLVLARAVSDAAGMFRLGPLPSGKHRVRIFRARIPLGRTRIEFGPAADATGVVIRLPALVAVEGVVVHAIDGRPLPDVRIGHRGGRELSPPLRTDEHGRFEILVGASETPWGNPGTTFFRDGFGPAERVREFSAGKPARIKMLPLGRVVLRAVNEAGDPVVGADVTAGRADPPNVGDPSPPGYSRVRSLSGLDGTAVLQWPQARRARIVAEHPRWGRCDRIVSVPAGEVHEIGDLVLRFPESKPVLVVRDEEGRPIPDAVLHMSGTSFAADEDGCIRTPYSYLHDAVLEAPGRARRRLDDEHLDRGQPRPREVVLRPGVTLLGRVVDPRGKGLPDIRVECWVWTTQTDPDGRFRFDGMPVDRTVKVAAMGFPFSGAFDWAWATPGPEPVVLRWPGHGRIRVRPAGGRHEWVWARIHLLDRRLEDGEYAISGGDPRWEDDEMVLSVPAGLLDVRVMVEPGAARIYSPVRVREGEEIRLDYGSPAPGTLHGRLVDTRNRPVRGAEILDARTGRLHAVTDAEGEIRLDLPDGPLWPLPAGPIRLVIGAKGFSPVTTETLDTSKHPDLSRALTPGGAVRVTILSDGEHPEKVRVRRLTERGPHSDWKYAPGARYALLEHVPPGRRRIEIRPEGRMPIFEDVEVAEGRTSEVEVRLPPR